MPRKIYRLLDMTPATVMGRHKEECFLGKEVFFIPLSLFFPDVFLLIIFTFLLS